MRPGMIEEDPHDPAWLAGYRVGKSGGTPDENPYDHFTRKRDQWHYGWETGDAEQEIK